MGLGDGRGVRGGLAATGGGCGCLMQVEAFETRKERRDVAGGCAEFTGFFVQRCMVLLVLLPFLFIHLCLLRSRVPSPSSLTTALIFVRSLGTMVTMFMGSRCRLGRTGQCSGDGLR